MMMTHMMKPIMMMMMMMIFKFSTLTSEPKRSNKYNLFR